MRDLSKQQKTRIRHAIEKALVALSDDINEPEVALRSLDEAMKRLNGREFIIGELRYDELDAACNAFLEEVNMPTLAVVVNHINHWQREETKVIE